MEVQQTTVAKYGNPAMAVWRSLGVIVTQGVPRFCMEATKAILPSVIKKPILNMVGKIGARASSAVGGSH